MENLKKPENSIIKSGSLIYNGNEVIKAKITLIEYNKELFKEERFEKCRKFKNENTIKCIKVNGFSHIEIQEIWKCFNLHPLVLEDINTDQRPKIEEYDKYLYLVLKTFAKLDSEIFIKQISFILGKNFVISFQEEESEIFDSIKKQINKKRT